MARIIHFGEDSCHRLKVLAGAGYSVERCRAIEDIQVLVQSPERLDALIISGECGKASRIAAFLGSAKLPMPVILFAGTDEPCTNPMFELVIPPLTPPSDWLSTIEAAIARFQIRPSPVGESRVFGSVALL